MAFCYRKTVSKLSGIIYDSICRNLNKHFCYHTRILFFYLLSGLSMITILPGSNLAMQLMILFNKCLVHIHYVKYVVLLVVVLRTKRRNITRPSGKKNLPCKIYLFLWGNPHGYHLRRGKSTE